MKYQNLVVGAGFAGCTIARLLAEKKNQTVLIIDKKDHIAGNAYDYYDESEILIQKYGPHIFHTNNRDVWNFLSRFTEWTPYQHKVRAYLEGKTYPIPININTVNSLYSTEYTPETIQNFYDSQKLQLEEINNSRDVIVSQVGTDLYEKFFKNYTKKQWGVYPEELSVEVIARVPVRTNYDDRYFTDMYQGMPTKGFTQMFKNMLSHPNIEIMVNTDYKELKNNIKYEKLFFTGPIDEFFDYKYGELPYRSLDFEFVTIDQEWYQEVAVVNYPNDFEFTRITEFKHWTFQKNPKTTIVKEYPKSEGDPYYPIPNSQNNDLYKKYADEAHNLDNVYFYGRLGKYRYFNMDKVVEDIFTDMN